MVKLLNRKRNATKILTKNVFINITNLQIVYDLAKKISNVNVNKTFASIFVSDMGRITLKSNALHLYYLPKMSIELALPLLEIEKVLH